MAGCSRRHPNHCQSQSTETNAYPVVTNKGKNMPHVPRKRRHLQGSATTINSAGATSYDRVVVRRRHFTLQARLPPMLLLDTFGAVPTVVLFPTLLAVATRERSTGFLSSVYPLVEANWTLHGTRQNYQSSKHLSSSTSKYVIMVMLNMSTTSAVQ